jgi:restriction system protein
MAVPDFQTRMLPLLKLTDDGQQHTYADSLEWLAQEFQFSDEDRNQLLKNGQTRLYNRVCWAAIYLRKAGLLQAVGRGRFELTDRGRDVLASRPELSILLSSRDFQSSQSSER